MIYQVHKACHEAGPITVRELSNALFSDVPTVRKFLRALLASGDVQEAGNDGRAKLYTAEFGPNPGPAGLDGGLIVCFGGDDEDV